MLFLGAPAIREPHLVAARQIHAGEEAFDTFRHEMRVVDREGPAQPRRFQRIEEVVALFEIVPKVMHLGVVRLPVHVLQQQREPDLLGMLAHVQEPVARGLPPHRDIGGEVIARVYHHPLAAEPLAGFHVAEQIAVDAVAHMRRDLRDVDSRERMDADVDVVLFADAAVLATRSSVSVSIAFGATSILRSR